MEKLNHPQTGNTSLAEAQELLFLQAKNLVNKTENSKLQELLKFMRTHESCNVNFKDAHDVWNAIYNKAVKLVSR